MVGGSGSTSSSVMVCSRFHAVSLLGCFDVGGNRVNWDQIICDPYRQMNVGIS